jgi:hypothetical protein
MSVEVVIPARSGEIDQPYRALIGRPYDSLSPDEIECFEEAGLYGELFIGNYDAASCTLQTQICGSTSVVSVTVEGVGVEILGAALAAVVDVII